MYAPRELEHPDIEGTGSNAPIVILIAPNVSEQMGGEAIKSLQIAETLLARGIDVHQITHDRCREGLSRRLPKLSVSYLQDTRFERICARHSLLLPLGTLFFHFRAVKVARRLAQENRHALIHVNQPVSPVIPLPRYGGVPIVVGPVNGNIYYPPGLRDREPLGLRTRRWLHRPAQLFIRLFFPGRRQAEVLLVAGGQRTVESLKMAGCLPERMVASLDSGIPDRLRDKPRIRHAGANHRFVHNGRLEPHKGIDLAIRAIAHTRTPATLDIIGRGSAEASLRELARRLCLEDRVRFLPWVEDHAAVADALRAYRAFVLPSLAEANGIVVQEAMMLGLPTICLDWGGPSQLIDGSCGVLVKPDSEASVITQIAGAIDRLGQDGELADHLSAAGRDKAIREGYCWSNLLEQWIGIYTALAACRE